MLLVGLCLIFLLGYSPQLFAADNVSSLSAQQQTKKVTGTVSDSKEPIIGVTVRVVGTSVATVTDLDGNYSIEAPAGSHTRVLLHRLCYQKLKLVLNRNTTSSCKKTIRFG